MIDWEAVARRLGHQTEAQMWDFLYNKKKMGIVALAESFDVSTTAVRLSMERCGVARRPAGGRKILVWPPDFEVQVELYGMRFVAQKLGYSYSTVYKELRTRRLRRAEALPLDPPD